MTNEERKNDISQKFYHMGTSLLEEGLELNEYAITQSATILLMLGSIMNSDEDMFIFSEICSMFSAKKILLDMEGMENFDDKRIVTELIKKRKEQHKLTPKRTRKKGPSGEETK